jgi:peptidoglycan-N-acetylglucosamine deacetylase
MLLRYRLHASAVLAVLLVVALGSWTGESLAGSKVTRFSRLHADAQASAVNPALPAHAPGSPSAPATPTPGAPSGTSPAAPTSPAGPTFTPGTVARTTGSDAVALTFDDGPGAQTLQILALLRARGVKATFCLIGVNVRQHPDLVQAIVRDGHTLCNHTWQHDLHLGQRSPQAIRADLQRTNDEIHKVVPGIPIKYFRHPGGMWTPAAVSVAQDMGMTSLGWNVDPSDWNTAAYPPGPIMTNHVIANVEQHVRPGSIILSHDGGGDRTSTVAAYRTLLSYLLDQRHFRLVPLPTGTRPGPVERDRSDR